MAGHCQLYLYMRTQIQQKVVLAGESGVSDRVLATPLPGVFLHIWGNVLSLWHKCAPDAHIMSFYHASCLILVLVVLEKCTVYGEGLFFIIFFFFCCFIIFSHLIYLFKGFTIFFYILL